MRKQCKHVTNDHALVAFQRVFCTALPVLLVLMLLLAISTMAVA
jgi:hypothetical protein